MLVCSAATPTTWSRYLGHMQLKNYIAGQWVAGSGKQAHSIGTAVV